jgi:hypothetical protein
MNITAPPRLLDSPLPKAGDSPPASASQTATAAASVDHPHEAGKPAAGPAEPPRLTLLNNTPQGAAAVLAELPSLDGPLGVQISAQISDRMLTLTELVQTVKKAMGEMRDLIAEGVVDAAQAQKRLIEAQARVLRFVNNPPTEAERKMLQTAQVQLQENLAALEREAAWISAPQGGQPLNAGQQATLDRLLVRIADDLVKIADLTQGSVDTNSWRDFSRPSAAVRDAVGGEAKRARLADSGYQADLGAWVASETGAASRDARQRLQTMHREGGVQHVFGNFNSVALARSTLASGAEVQALVATLMDDILPADVLEDVQQGLAMLQAFSAADLALAEALKADRFGGRSPESLSFWEVRNFEREVSEALKDGDTLSFQGRGADGRSAGWRSVKLDANELRASVLLGDLSHAREALKKELKELAELQGSLAQMEQALGELVRLIAIESALMSSQWDTQTLGDLTRELVQHPA